jgi:hypothetical protein
MALHCATELRAIAELLDAIEKFQCDHSHDLILTGSLDVSDGSANPTIGQVQITEDNWHYVPTTEETKENE